MAMTYDAQVGAVYFARSEAPRRAVGMDGDGTPAELRRCEVPTESA